MTRIFVTGAVGRLGREVVRQFVDAGHEVVGGDRATVDGALPEGVLLVELDMLDLGQVAQAMRDCDALVHLAAIPAPYGRPDDVVFRNNVLATFNALQGASLAGIRSVALASSGSIYGTAWAPDYVAYATAPVTEDTELANHDVYGLGKEVDEHTARMFCRRDGMSIACLRFHWIAQPDEQRSAAKSLAEPDADLLGSGRGLWGYVDVRDAASACVQAVTTAMERPFGFAALNITAADTLSAVPTEELIRSHSPSTQLLSTIEGTATAFDLTAAEQVIGWRPRYSWRDS